jgi:hypothetical protein
MEWIQKAQTNPNGRFIGIVYLLYFLTAILAQLLISHGLVATGNFINVIATVLYVIMAVLFYLLFKPVNKTISLIAALFSLAGCVLTMIAIFLQSFPINPLWFFGPYCIMIGYLIIRSLFLPHFIGWLVALAGVGWLIFLIPNRPDLSTYCIEGLGVVAEASLMLWLIIKGVNVQRWKQQPCTE